jgi:hypothetical protein
MTKLATGLALNIGHSRFEEEDDTEEEALDPSSFCFGAPVLSEVP